MEWFKVFPFLFVLYPALVRSNELQNTTNSLENNNTFAEFYCWNEGPFKSLQMCSCYCFHQEQQNTCETVDQDAMIFKSVYINQNEYEVTSNRSLLLTDSLSTLSKTHFTQDEYFLLKNHSAILCYPFHPEFYNCPKVSLKSDMFYLLNDKSVHDKINNRNYTIDFYKKTHLNIEVCKINNFLDFQTTCPDGESFPLIETCSEFCLFGTKSENISDVDWNIQAYKSVYLTKTDYKILNTTLILIGSLKESSKTNFTDKEYYIFNDLNNSAVLCYPLNPEFNKCPKGLLEKEQFILLNNGSIYDKINKKTHTIDLYKKFTQFEGVEICQVIDNVVNSGKTLPSCPDGEGYPSLGTCVVTCLFYSNTYDFPEDVDWNKLTYKSVYLSENEYEISNNTLILINSFKELSKTHFTEKEYFLFDKEKNNYSAVLCYLLNPKFENCTKNTIESTYFNTNRDKSVYVNIYDVDYAIDFYTKNYDGSIITCVNEMHNLVQKITSAAYLCSSVCLLITFILILILLNHQSNFSLICHVFMLWILSLVIVVSFERPVDDENNKYFCPLLPLLAQYFGLSAFFWMNIYVYSIYSTFSHLKISQTHKVTRKRRLIQFFLCMGIPLFITIITLIMDLIDVPLMKPMFIEKCTFENDGSSYLYLHGFMCISIFLNVLFMIRIVTRGCKLAKDASTVNKDATKQMCFLAGKLIVITGLCYITNLIYSGVLVWGGFWEYLDIISALQGVFIFIVYICNKRTIVMFIAKCKTWLKLERKITSVGSVETVISNISNETIL